MNLLFDPWLPARRKDGSVGMIAPWQLTDQHKDNPWVTLDLPRADFQGAGVQFLISVLQTCWTPLSEDQWFDRLEEPPDTAQLQQAFVPFKEAFELLGDGPRFMQDLHPLEDDTKPKDYKPIEQHLVDAPGDNTVKLNKDLFVKAASINKMRVEAVAMALYALQVHAPSGGAGHRQSPRGGGPITTVLWGGTLWECLWRNVFPLFKVDPRKRQPVKHQADIFPWMKATRTSAKEGKETTVDDVHPLQILWPMPRRIRLLSQENVKGENCDIMGQGAPETLFTHYVTLNYGTNYTGPWIHPLSPYSTKLNKQNQPYKVTTSSFGPLGYQHWLGLVQQEAKRKIMPAPIVSAGRRDRDRSGAKGLVLWSFGYDMDNMKALAWRTSQMPLLATGPEGLQAVESYTERMVLGAEDASFQVVQGVRSAFSRRPGDLKLDRSILTGVRARFRAQTQASFFVHLEQLHQVIPAVDSTVLSQQVVESWRRTLLEHAMGVWDDFSQSGHFQAVDPARIARAHNKLRGYLMSKKFKQILGLLPLTTKETA